jgi:signal transduction histidine kinase/ActR/RegA family two-component response regulator
MPVTIRSRILLLVLAVLLPALVGVGWLVATTFQSERAAHQRTLRETARALSMVVDAELAERMAIARTLSGSRWLDSGSAVSADELSKFLRLARNAAVGIDGWIELRRHGQTLLDTREGSVGAPRPIEDAGEGLVDTPQVRPLLGQGRDAHTEVVHPVQRNGHVELNVVLAWRPGELQAIIDAQRLPADWVGAVLDDRHVVVARHPGGTAFSGRPATADLRERLQQGREGYFESRSIEGEPMTGYFRTLPMGWTYVIGMPRGEFAGRVPVAVAQVMFGAATLLALAVFGAIWVARRIVEPVHSLKQAAERMRSGQPVPATSTGLVECDAVAVAMAEAAESMRNNRSDLERQVAAAVDRTRQAEQRASQSQRIEALGRLTGGVAHDFNNLLGVISNSAHLIQRHADVAELQVPVAATLRAVEVGSRLTQHLLRFAGRRPVRPQSLDLARYLPELQDLLRSVLGRRITVSVQVASGTLPVRVDAGELELAMINLALNARDAMPSGGELQLRARNADHDDATGLPGAPRRRFVLIAVTDDGLGLEADLAERVFEPFFTTKGVGQGTGLGLSQVHGFCTQAGGTARLASTPGLGTTVSLLLPASEGRFDDDVSGTTAPAAGRDLADARVLLVEDNDELSGVTAALLRALGAQVAQARDAQHALKLIDSEPPFDVVLSDVVMPGDFDGVELARRLRRDRPDLPVVLISGFSTSAAAADFKVLRKPCPEDELLGALHEAIAIRRRASQVQP